MREIGRKLSMVFALVFMAFFFTACGGGSGGGGGTTTLSDSYSGSRSQATITESSAEIIAVDAYNGTETGGGLTGLIDTASMSGGSTTPLAVASVSRAVSNTLSGGIPRATQSSDPMPGGCGGSASYIVDANDQTGDFTFTFTFNSFCETDGFTETVINGSLSFSGKVDLATEELEYMTITFSSLTSATSDGSEDITLQGSIKATMSNSTSGTVTMSFVATDNDTGETYWVDNYVSGSTDYGAYEEVTLSGRFYGHEEGYVDLTTVTPLKVYSTDEYPSSGMLQLDGADNNSVRLEFLSSTTYQVTADLNGDGFYDDHDSGVKAWQ